MKLLIVDDDPNICHIIQLYLKKNNYESDICYTGREAIKLFSCATYDLIILDLMLPELDGYEVCRRIREKSTVPIIMLTAKGESDDKIQGLDIGADDYLTKPFDMNELMARIKAINRRIKYNQLNLSDNSDKIVYDNLCLDIGLYEVFLAGKKVKLARREFQLLHFFVNNPQRVFTREKIIEKVWGWDFEGDNRVVDLYIRRLRHKLKIKQQSWSIKTVWGIGYKFEISDSYV